MYVYNSRRAACSDVTNVHVALLSKGMQQFCLQHWQAAVMKPQADVLAQPQLHSS